MNVYTAPSHRRQGLARKMVLMLTALALSRGVTEISLDSTKSGRVLKSRESFIEQMKDNAPGLNIVKYHETKDKNDRESVEVRGYDIPKDVEAAGKKDVKHYSKYEKALRSQYDYNAFAAKIFVHPDSISTKDLGSIARNCYNALKNGVVNNIESMNLGRYYTPSELYALWLVGDFWWAKLMRYPDYRYYRVDWSGKGFVKCLIEDADEAVGKRSHTAATLRFSHDTYLMPIMCTFPLEEVYLDCDPMEIPERFQNFRIICPACNIQMVFYRNNRNKVLVKFLLNEKETRIHGFEPDNACFYEWPRLRAYLKSII